jgi:predicted ATPase
MKEILTILLNLDNREVLPRLRQLSILISLNGEGKSDILPNFTKLKKLGRPHKHEELKILGAFPKVP